MKNNVVPLFPTPFGIYQLDVDLDRIYSSLSKFKTAPNYLLSGSESDFERDVSILYEDEFFDLFCDLSNDYVSDKYWMGELGTGLISPYDERKYRDSLLYTSPNYGILDIDLTDPFTNCATDMRLDEMCYWRFESFSIFQPDLVIYRHYDFPAEQHYGSENVTNACSNKEIENLKNS